MKYTDEQIKKALELCVNWEAEYCEKCPFDDECENDGDIPLRNALDLINRYEAEIERLRKSNEELASESDARDIDETLIIARAKSEAIVEFAELLVRNTVPVQIGERIYSVITKEGIAHYTKEKLGESNVD